MQPFHRFDPFPAASDMHWIEWFEALLSNGRLLVRCIPLSDHELPEGARSLLLDFGPVIAFRATEDPYSFGSALDSARLPRDAKGRLSGLIFSTDDSDWLQQAKAWNPGSIRHFVVLSTQEQVLEVLTERQQPVVQLEHGPFEPNPWPVNFAVLPK